MGRLKYAVVSTVAVLMLVTVTVDLDAQAGLNRETDVMAGFIYSFTRFVHWPDSAFAASDQFVITVVGRDPFEGALATLLAGKKVDARPVSVVLLGRSDNAPALQRSALVFVSRSEREREVDIVAAVRGRPILTISDNQGFAPRGGMIGLFETAGAVRFEINRASAEQSGLTFSSKILSLATQLYPARSTQ